VRTNPVTGDLPVADCWKRLRSATHGFVALSDRALPVILPARYYVEDGLVVMCLGPQAAFHPVLENAVVAFVVGTLDPGTATGWAVHIQGVLRARVGSGRLDGCPDAGGVAAVMEPITMTGWNVDPHPLTSTGWPTPATD
jgi:hypothetical protein